MMNAAAGWKRKGKGDDRHSKDLSLGQLAGRHPYLYAVAISSLYGFSFGSSPPTRSTCSRTTSAKRGPCVAMRSMSYKTDPGSGAVSRHLFDQDAPIGGHELTAQWMHLAVGRLRQGKDHISKAGAVRRDTLHVLQDGPGQWSCKQAFVGSRPSDSGTWVDGRVDAPGCGQVPSRLGDIAELKGRSLGSGGRIVSRVGARFLACLDVYGSRRHLLCSGQWV